METDVKNIIVTIHGIRTISQFNWQRLFGVHLKYDTYFKNWIHKRPTYGYLLTILCVMPFVRYHYIRWFKRYLRKLQSKYPNSNINIIAHSYGTMLAYEAVRRSREHFKKQPIKINKLILVSSIVSSHEDFSDTVKIGLIKEVYNYCSYRDRVCQLNPFGHSGYWGFLPPNKREHIEEPYPNVHNRRFEVTHSQWFDEEPPDFYQLWREELLR